MAHRGRCVCTCVILEMTKAVHSCTAFFRNRPHLSTPRPGTMLAVGTDLQGLDWRSTAICP